MTLFPAASDLTSLEASLESVESGDQLAGANLLLQPTAHTAMVVRPQQREASLDSYCLHWYYRELRLAFHEKKFGEFQNLFASIMEARYGSDFIRVKPYGRDGDRKNDGILRSRRLLFQVYAPNELKAATAIIKIEEDFNGALHHWREHFDSWVFVHNALDDGLPPLVVAKLGELERQSGVRLMHWSFPEFWKDVQELPDVMLERLLPAAPIRNNRLVVPGVGHLKPVLEHITRLPVQQGEQIRTVPAEKLEYNLLSEDVKGLIQLGMGRSPQVEQYFWRHGDPTYRDETAEGFHQKYLELKRNGRNPDDVFTGLQRYAGGSELNSPQHQSAVLAVLAYFFEACDIFERPFEETA